MADFKALADSAISLAKMAGMFIPGLTAGATIAEKAISILDDLIAESPDPATTEELKSERARISAKVQSVAGNLEAEADRREREAEDDGA